jgi:Proteasome subunit
LTLIICIKATDYIVMAADRLTTVGQRVISCDTQKLHQISSHAITTASGCSMILGRYWSQIIPNFLSLWVGPDFATIVSEFRQSLDSEIAHVPKNNVGACVGGNAFLLAGFDPTTSGMVISRIERFGDARKFSPETIVAPAAQPRYISWIGDTANLKAYIDSKDQTYSPGLSQPQAINFAVDAIVDGIRHARNAGITTIGGDFVYAAVASQAGVSFSRRASGFPCIAGTSNGISGNLNPTSGQPT